MDRPRIQDYFAAIIKRTGDPNAPLLMQEAATYAERFGRTLTPLANAGIVEEIQERMLVSFTDDDPLFHSTEYVIALAVMFKAALMTWANKTVELDRQWGPKESQGG
jgi:hypothetical protein